jgi:hypothetical protein
MVGLIRPTQPYKETYMLTEDEKVTITTAEVAIKSVAAMVNGIQHPDQETFGSSAILEHKVASAVLKKLGKYLDRE